MMILLFILVFFAIAALLVYLGLKLLARVWAELLVAWILSVFEGLVKGKK
jgi:hypothetical protein